MGFLPSLFVFLIIRLALNVVFRSVLTHGDTHTRSVMIFVLYYVYNFAFVPITVSLCLSSDVSPFFAIIHPARCFFE